MAKGFTQEFTLLCRRQLGCDVWTSRAVVRLWAEFATQKLREGQRVEIQGFGSFRLKKYTSKRCGTVNVVRFKASPTIRKNLNQKA